MIRPAILLTCLALAACGGGGGGGSNAPTAPPRAAIENETPLPPAEWVRHEIDDEPYALHCSADAVKLILYLHSWGGSGWQARDYYPDGIPGACVVSPNFGGKNDDALAMGSDDTLARIDRALADAKAKTGMTTVHAIAYSAGTMAALNYMGKYPGKVQRASLWKILYDLELFHNTTTGLSYIADMEAVLGVPTPNDPDYLARSPRSRLAGITGVEHIYLNVGSFDYITVPEHGELALRHLQARGVSVTLTYHQDDHGFGSALRALAVEQLEEVTQ